MEEKSLTLATYNIHSCIGNDGRYDPDRIIQVLKGLKADVIALQEVSSNYDDDLKLLDYMAAQVCMTVIPGPTMFRETSDYGNAVLASTTVEEITHINISHNNREPRGAISLVVKTGIKRVQMIVTHLGLSRYERRPQAEQILRFFSESAADVSVLMGDLNEWYPWSAPLRRLRWYFNDINTPATFPAGFPVLPLDRILVHPSALVSKIEAVKNPLTRIASDHLPLTATLDVRLK